MKKNRFKGLIPISSTLVICTVIYLFAFNQHSLRMFNPSISSNSNQDRVCSIIPAIEAPKALTRDAEGLVSLPYEIHVCKGLGLAYVHIYKNGGTAISKILISFCEKTTGKKPIMYAFFWKNTRLPSLESVCDKFMCFTFWREPVDRFFSSYHEIMKRMPKAYEKVLQQFALPSSATQELKIATLTSFFNLVKTGAIRDPHILPQTSFIMDRSGQLVIPGLAVYSLNRLDQILPVLLCGAHSRACSPSIEECPYRKDMISDNHQRDRSSPEYSLPQYLLKEEEVDRGLVEDIAMYFSKDYCFFGIPPHPAILQELRCL